MLQQVDTPQYLYEHPVNLFVAGFIGSPAMNLMEATVSATDGSVTVDVGGFRLSVPSDAVARRPALRGYDGKKVILGIRPEDMEDASLVADAPSDRRISSTVDLREALGSDVVAHFRLKAPQALTEDVKELAADVGQEALDAVGTQAEAGESTVVARLNPRTQLKEGQSVELVVDTERLHFFDVDTGSAVREDARA
jgi:multiple sugar transport system ATP-binding protein